MCICIYFYTHTHTHTHTHTRTHTRRSWLRLMEPWWFPWVHRAQVFFTCYFCMSLFTYIGRFCRSLFTFMGVHRAQVCYIRHFCRSLFTYIGRFSRKHFLFHAYGSLFTRYIGRFSRIHFPFHVYGSLFIRRGFFWHDGLHERAEFGLIHTSLLWVSFSTYWSLFTFICYFSNMSLLIYTSLL